MNKAIPAALLLLLLAGCISLPGSDFPDTSRYSLPVTNQGCTPGDTPLALRVPRVSAGLDSNRIARRNAATGEITYLKDVRWAEDVRVLVEQRLARDLECHGFTAVSSHHHTLDQSQLVCEVRAFNLVQEGSRDTAEVGLSCIYYGSGNAPDRPVVTMRDSAVTDWSAPAAVAAVSDAYELALADLLAGMR